jgi:hypothetical protein
VKKTVTRVVLAVVASGAIAAAALAASSSAPVGKPGSGPVAGSPPVTGTTAVAFTPASNPAFKVNGGAVCAKPNATGHLWVDSSVVATSLYDLATNEVRVEIGNGAKGTTLVLNAADNWTAGVPSSVALPCSVLDGTSIAYTAKSYSGNHVEQSIAGLYPITKID